MLDLNDLRMSFQPPIALFGLEGRYANALYSAASKNKKLDAVEKDLLKFQAAVHSDPKLADFVFNPLVNRNVSSSSQFILFAVIPWWDL